MAVTSEDIRSSSRSLSESLKAEQERRAVQARTEGYQSLSNQMRQQRTSMQQARGQISEQGWQTRRAISQQAQARGVGSSGLKDLSLVQSQMAGGRASSELEQQNTQVQRAAMESRQGMDQTMESDIRSSELGLREALLQSDREYRETRDREKADLLALMEMANDPNVSPEMLKNYMDIMVTDDLTRQQTEDIILGASTDPVMDRQIKTSHQPGKWASRALGLPIEALQSAAGRLMYGKEFADFDYDPTDGEGRAYEYTMGAQKVSFRSNEHASEYFKELYSGFPESDQIEIRANRYGNVNFRTSGKTYNTYNKALEAVRGS